MHKAIKGMTVSIAMAALLVFPASAQTVYKNALTPSSESVITSNTRQADPYGKWKWTQYGWWWQNTDGTFPKNTWAWLDGNKDGLAECYCFDKDGWMLHDMTTANGYTVNSDGQWTLNGIVYRKDAKNISGASYQIQQTYADGKLSDVVQNITVVTSPGSSYSTTVSDDDREEMTVSEYKDFLDSISSLGKTAQNEALDILKKSYKIVND